MSQSKFPVRDKRNGDCYYCGKPRNHPKDCYKMKYNESKQRNRDSKNLYKMKYNESKNLKLFVSNVALFAETDDVNACLINFGTSLHMSCNKDWFDEYHDNIDGTCVYLGDNRSLQLQGYGLIGVMLPNGEKRQIHDVMYVPSIKKEFNLSFYYY